MRPSLNGLYGSLVHLQDGSTVRADERYIRDCDPAARSQIVAGYPPVMPYFCRPDRRGRRAEADRLYPIPRADRRGADERRSPPIGSDQLPDRRATRSARGCFTTDHKRIALLLFRLDHVLLFHRRRCGDADPPASGDPERRCCSADIYNRMFTMHGIVMVWFFLIPSIPTTFGNFLVPLMIGAHDLAFPRINLASWYVFNLSRPRAALCADHGRRRYRLDLLHAVFDAVLPTATWSPRRWRCSSTGFPRS